MIVEDWIEFLPRPKELLLVWQAPRHVNDRTRWVVGRLRETDAGAVFEYLQEPEFSNFNQGRSQADLEVAGFAGFHRQRVLIFQTTLHTIALDPPRQ